MSICFKKLPTSHLTHGGAPNNDENGCESLTYSALHELDSNTTDLDRYGIGSFRIVNRNPERRSFHFCADGHLGGEFRTKKIRQWVQNGSSLSTFVCNIIHTTTLLYCWKKRPVCQRWSVAQNITRHSTHFVYHLPFLFSPIHSHSILSSSRIDINDNIMRWTYNIIIIFLIFFACV